MSIQEIAETLTSVYAALNGLEIRAGRNNAYRLAASMDDIERILKSINHKGATTNADVHAES